MDVPTSGRYSVVSKWLSKFSAGLAAVFLFTSIEMALDPGFGVTFEQRAPISIVLFCAFAAVTIFSLNRWMKARFVLCWDPDTVWMERAGKVEWSLNWCEFRGLRFIATPTFFGGLSVSLVDSKGHAHYPLHCGWWPKRDPPTGPVVPLLATHAPVDAEWPMLATDARLSPWAYVGILLGFLLLSSVGAKSPTARDDLALWMVIQAVLFIAGAIVLLRSFSLAARVAYRGVVRTPPPELWTGSLLQEPDRSDDEVP